MQCQGYCPTGARSPDAPMICSWATTLLNKEYASMPQTDDSYGNSLYAYFQ